MIEPIRAGDVFTFVGLPDQEPHERTLIIHGVSTSGNVSYVIRSEGNEPQMSGIDYLTLKALIADGIWEPL